jgi:hypothetical protein
VSSEVCTILLPFLTVDQHESSIGKLIFLSVTVYSKKKSLPAEQDRKTPQRLAFQPVSKAHTNKLNMFQQCTYIVYICGYKRKVSIPSRLYYNVVFILQCQKAQNNFQIV